MITHQLFQSRKNWADKNAGWSSNKFFWYKNCPLWICLLHAWRCFDYHMIRTLACSGSSLSPDSFAQRTLHVTRPFTAPLAMIVSSLVNRLKTSDILVCISDSEPEVYPASSEFVLQSLKATTTLTDLTVLKLSSSWTLFHLMDL